MTVIQIQHLLAYLGYDPGDCDGAMGRNTQAAVRRFQADYGLTAERLRRDRQAGLGAFVRDLMSEGVA